MVAALGGPGDIVERPAACLGQAPVVRAVRPAAAGFVTAIDTRALGLAVVQLGGGRRRAGNGIDPRVGLAAVRAIGERVGDGEPLCEVHAADETTEEACAAR